MRMDKEWREAADAYRSASYAVEEAKAAQAEAKKRLLSLAGDDDVSGYGVSVKHIIKRGSIDYKAAAIDHLPDGFDFEGYRKDETIYTNVTINKE